MISPLILGILGFIAVISLGIIDNRFKYIAVFIYFWVIYAKYSEQIQMATFYLIGALFIMVMSFTNFTKISDRKEISLFGKTFKGKYVDIVAVGLGIVFWLFMGLLQKAQEVAIIGVPKLAMSAQNLNPFTSGILGIIENGVIFVLIALFMRLPFVVINIAGPIVPFIMGAVFFSFLHSFVLAASFIFAFVIMILWVLTYYFFGETTIADTGHFLWNFFIEISRGSSLIIQVGDAII